MLLFVEIYGTRASKRKRERGEGEKVYESVHEREGED